MYPTKAGQIIHDNSIKSLYLINKCNYMCEGAFMDVRPPWTRPEIPKISGYEMTD